MKTYLTKNENYPHGVCLTIENDGVISEIAVELSRDNTAYKLPDNPSNRKFVQISKFDKCNGYVELNAIERNQSANGPRSQSAPRKGLEEYLEGEDKELYLALVEKAKKAREEANKKAPMTELEKAIKARDKWLAKIAELQNQSK